MLAICLVNPSSITKKQSKIKERTEMRFWWVNQPITSSWMLKYWKIWSQKWLKHRGELPDGTTQKREVHRDMKYNLHGTVWFTRSNSHLPAWCCTAGWRRAAGGWPPPAAAGHCGTGAALSPPPRGSSGRSDRLVLPEPSASGTPFQTKDAKNKASATVRQICRTPRAFDAAKKKYNDEFKH